MTHPIRQQPRRVPLSKQAAAEQCVAEMRAAGVIEPSSSSWVSPNGTKESYSRVAVLCRLQTSE